MRRRRLTADEFESLTSEEILAGVSLQSLDESIKAFKKQFRWKEARAALSDVLRRNLPRGQR